MHDMKNTTETLDKIVIEKPGLGKGDKISVLTKDMILKTSNIMLLKEDTYLIFHIDIRSCYHESGKDIISIIIIL